MMKSVVRGLCLIASCLLSGLTGPAIAAERLEYKAEIKSPLTLWDWVYIGDATFDTRQDVACGEGLCHETRLWFTSENSDSLLETAYPLRYLYRSLYRLDEQSSFAFEIVRKERKHKGPGEYAWRHRVIWLAQNQGATRYDLAASGDALPQDVAAWITTAKAQALTLKAKNIRPVAMELPALDRAAAFQWLRTLDLKQGGRWSFRGADPHGNLGFEIKVQAREPFSAAGRQWHAWKLQVKEIEEKSSDILYIWLADDARRTPLRVEMNQSIGQLRLTLR